MVVSIEELEFVICNALKDENCILCVPNCDIPLKNDIDIIYKDLEIQEKQLKDFKINHNSKKDEFGTYRKRKNR